MKGSRVCGSDRHKVDFYVVGMKTNPAVSNRLENKVALITGGARGMGEAHARAMVAEGACVVLGDVLDDEGHAVAESLGDQASYIHLDVTDRGQWSRAVVRAIDDFGHLNVLVNNAGIVIPGSTSDFSVENWDKVIAVNLTGTFHGIAAAHGALSAAGRSSIINISSTAGLKGYGSLAAYTASKFGVRGLTKAVALEFAPEGIRCNSVHPGAIDTPMIRGFDLPQDHVAMHRIGQPEEVASLVVYLASDESSFCTGAEFVADGGETSGLAGNVV